MRRFPRRCPFSGSDAVNAVFVEVSHADRQQDQREAVRHDHMGDRHPVRKRRRPLHQAADDFPRWAGVDVGIEDKVLPISRLACVDHDRAVGEVDVVEGVDHPLLFDEGGGVDGLKDVRMMKEPGRQRGSSRLAPHLFRFRGRTVVYPVFGHHDYRYEKHYPGKLSLSISRLPCELPSKAQDLQL